MSYLRSIDKQNLEQIQRVEAFLKVNNIDLNNLPHFQQPPPINVKKKQITMCAKNQISEEDEFAAIDYYFKNKNNVEPKVFESINNFQQKETSEHDSDSFDIEKYMLQKKNKKEIRTNFQKEYTKNINKEDFFFEQYSYQNQKNNPKTINGIEQYSMNNQSKARKCKKNQVNRRMPSLVNRNLKYTSMIDVFKSSSEPLTKNYIMASNKEWQNYKIHEDYRLLYVLSKFPKIKQFRGNQKAVIKCGLENHNIFVCMPTGGGKSLTFQTLTFLVKGVYLCVLPLISLIFDQQSQALTLGIQAYSLTSNTDSSIVKVIYNKLQNFKDAQNSIVIFCTPEKLNLSQQFSALLDTVYNREQLKRIIIDEVHCVSTWGKQFRIEYENLSSIKKRFPKTPLLALTATVTEVIKQDIIKRLGIQNCYFFQSSFNRPNLYYEVRHKDKNVLMQILQISNRSSGKSGIIYCLSRKECEQMSDRLNKMGLKTAYYHADMKEDQKKYIQENWMKNNINIIVATVAFGMGINKPDVRFVIHHTLSKSLENYYQESGRAGRDGEYSECILFYRKSDKQGLMNMTLKNDFSTMQNKQFSAKQLAQMIKYCQQKYMCRRQFQLRYLGETDFDSKMCKKTCDNCRSDRKYQEYECIEYGKMLITNLLLIQEAKVSVSKNQLISIIRGKVEKNIKYKLDQMRQMGVDLEGLKEKFGGWKIEEIEMMIIQFLSCELLFEKLVENQIYRKNANTNVINSYIKCDRHKCNIFLQRVQTFPLQLSLGFKNKQLEEDLGENDNSNTQEESVDNETSDQELKKIRQKSLKLMQKIFEQDSYSNEERNQNNSNTF